MQRVVAAGAGHRQIRGRLVFESHVGRALVPIPKTSTSPRATSTLQRWIVCKALDLERPIREADKPPRAKIQRCPLMTQSGYQSAAQRLFLNSSVFLHRDPNVAFRHICYRIIG